MPHIPRQLLKLYGVLTVDGKMATGDTPRKDYSRYNVKKYKFFLDDGAPPISSQCCVVMKKNPAHKYSKDTGRTPITAQMATESQLRTQQWLNNGCNGFNLKAPISNPMSFWTEQDVLQYISDKRQELIDWRVSEIESLYNCSIDEIRDDKTGERKFSVETLEPIADIYGSVVCNTDCRFRTTGAERTGCMFCGYGCHREKPPGDRFFVLNNSHPNIYDYVMRGGAFDENGDWRPDKRGLGMWYCIEFINSHGNFKIQYPNREHYIEEYMTDEIAQYLNVEDKGE